MAIYKVREGQNLFDLAVQLYGDAQSILQICVDNELSLTADIAGNDLITYDDNILRQTNATLYLALNSVDIV
nr:hypothetical protein [Tanacetum cinerariifolium]